MAIDKKLACSTVVLLCVLPVYLCAEPGEWIDHPEDNAGAHKSPHYNKDIHNPVFDRDALLALHNVKELTELPQEVRWKRLKILAKSYDKNNNDIIEPEELHAWVMQSFKLIDREEAHEKMQEDDEDRDGKVSFAEVLAKSYGYTEADVKELEAAEKEEEGTDVLPLIGDDRKRFDLADQDKDGFLDDDEFQAYFQPYDHPHMVPLEMEKTLRDLDKDKDGSVSMEEFIHDAIEEEQEGHEREQFKELDINKDEKLDYEELKAFAIVTNSQLAYREIEHLTKVVDDNKDKAIQIDEIIKAEDKFMGSVVTDYGRMVHFVKEDL